jgi:hypothetical protein
MQHARRLTPIVCAVLLVSPVAQAQEGRKSLPIRHFTIVVGDGQKIFLIDAPDSRPPQPARRGDDGLPTLVDPPPVAPPPPDGIVDFPNLGTAVLSPDNFDRRVFGQDRQTTRGMRMDELLSAKVKGASREHDLEDAERAKLYLAGRGDINRFFDQVDAERAVFEVSRWTFEAGRRALSRLDPLARIYQQGPFEEGSLFAKVLVKILADREAADAKP